MKNIAMAACAVLISGPALAANNPVQCEPTAFQVATYIDELGWGRVPSEPLKVVSGERGEHGSETIRVKSTVSGFTYTIVIQQDFRSESCIVLSVN